MAGKIQNVQIEGIEPTVKAYKDARIPAFSVGDGRDINIRYNGDDINEGAQLLLLWLQRLAESGTYQLYQIRLYEGIKDSDRITNKTLYDLAFNFRLHKRQDTNLATLTGNSGAGGPFNTNQVLTLLQEMQELKVQNAILELKANSRIDDDDENDDDDDDEKKAPEKSMKQKFQQGMVDQALPVFGELLRGIAKAFQPNIQQSTSLAGGTILNSTNVNEEKKISDAIERLKKVMPADVSVGDMLTKLAEMGEKNKPGLHHYMSILMKL